MNKNFIVCKIGTNRNDENENGESKQLKANLFFLLLLQSNKQLHYSHACV